MDKYVLIDGDKINGKVIVHTSDLQEVTVDNENDSIVINKNTGEHYKIKGNPEHPYYNVVDTVNSIESKGDNINNLRYLYWSDDNNVGFYKERKEDKELTSIDVLEILQRNNINNFLKKFDSKYMVVTKEGIYKLEKCNSIGIYTYKKVETFEPYEGELTIYNEDKWLDGVKRNSNIKSYTFEEDESDETI
ncbi:hypothetical protein CPAST_c25880 [Clostridium pasteurianum DSM 525 = ATCC 6013]|uniref:Uncharacterized protein n=1 Tax=Clostridium pasteurianum DSM 525 = ATCC 6013 TaxID=1262449 RepID=A0A0H3J658_CLOPA|nr:hypothetical protein [Clostridium pasteurianum]AJA48657.1 hypothetical protein CPAST_c25880 [Clostridium pasteurianum DSM 525 = ATCC 6013]AJA52645.1 hypothetical protein CLPA_c25880 [Clostridium pasteurianum DSM 525 = ATCC 6013]AOZ75885.1 hypothetical protein AQ983_12580 [Clostridium pasteurianum DSM 525 = ATCC 6013]AOZ79681.1 hypothetical protein AQ984_12575 [Clostridium pasteurianum]ELP59957.1 hypothetical protein F502_04957 [Clostridium pasteurianum DSM 525 = ATCC 6013]